MQNKGVTPSGSGCQPTASAASASSLSGIPNAVDLDAATPSQIERANAAVTANLTERGLPKYQSAQGYACALTAIMQSDVRGK